jgi:hypothetical protein
MFDEVMHIDPRVLYHHAIASLLPRLRTGALLVYVALAACAAAEARPEATDDPVQPLEQDLARPSATEDEAVEAEGSAGAELALQPGGGHTA